MKTISIFLKLSKLFSLTKMSFPHRKRRSVLLIVLWLPSNFLIVLPSREAHRGVEAVSHGDWWFWVMGSTFNGVIGVHSFEQLLLDNSCDYWPGRVITFVRWSLGLREVRLIVRTCKSNLFSLFFWTIMLFHFIKWLHDCLLLVILVWACHF